MIVSEAPATIPTDIIGEHAAEVDREARFPDESMAVLRAAGLLALGIPDAYGGPGGTATDLVAAVEHVATACASTAMVYTMHLVAAQTLLGGTAGAEDGVKAATLREIAAGSHLSTLAYSERGSRSHFWAQVSRATPDDGAAANGGATADGGAVRIDADKSWVTSAGHADSYITATGALGMSGPLETELYLVDARSAGIEVLGAFDGLGMRGNASSPVAYRGVRVGAGRRLGEPGSGFGLMLSATLPWFVLCGAATCVGIASAAIEAGTEHISGARFQHLGSSLAEIPGVRARLAEAKIRHLQARALLYQVARQVERGAPEAQLGILALKAAAAEMAIDVTDEVMRACGGAAFSKHLGIERNFRDARASSVMAPTTDVMRDLIGRALTGLELFG
jgi:alkylation response protein AidB-like acyl-CoA dehydrogenase